MYVSVCARTLSETNERIYAKFTLVIDDMSGVAQKNVGDLMSKIKVTGSQKVNNRYNGRLNYMYKRY